MFEDGAGVWRVPVYGAIMICHGENALGVGIDGREWVKLLLCFSGHRLGVLRAKKATCQVK